MINHTINIYITQFINLTLINNSVQEHRITSNHILVMGYRFSPWQTENQRNFMYVYLVLISWRFPSW